MSRRHEPFELDPATYDRLVDWPRRLANEEPFYRKHFAAAGVQRVLDVACGTGRHVGLFHSWGLTAAGADLDPEMIAWCRAQYGESGRLQWAQRSFTEPTGATFDAAICVGNSLALVPDLPTMHAALRSLHAALRTGGLCIIQVVNLWRMPDGPTAWPTQRCLPDSNGTRVVLKGIHRTGDRGYVDFVDLRVRGTRFSAQFHSATFLGLRADELRAAACAAGGAEVQIFGNFQEAPYEPDTSPDIIVLSRRG